jgi:hypothetical protein
MANNRIFNTQNRRIWKEAACFKMKKSGGIFKINETATTVTTLDVSGSDFNRMSQSSAMLPSSELQQLASRVIMQMPLAL